jgi:transposase-like protein
MIGKEYHSILEVQEAFRERDSCLEYLEEARWEGNVISPFDRTSKVYRCKRHRFYCKNTGKYFNALTGTFLENTKVSLTKWMIAVWLLSSCKKGISSYQLARTLGVTQKTAWFMLHRLRVCCADTETVLDGEVEMDETFVGGKNKNRHRDKKIPKSCGRAHIDKTPVLGMVQRGGKLVAQVIPDTSQRSITPIVLQRVNRSATVYTDEWQGYDKVDKLYHREFVDHGRKQYANGDVTTNRIEGFWGIFKRGIIGVYQMASRKHLQRYVDEFVWRYNTREATQSQRFSMFFANFDRRLRFKDLCYG